MGQATVALRQLEGAKPLMRLAPHVIDEAIVWLTSRTWRRNRQPWLFEAPAERRVRPKRTFSARSRIVSKLRPPGEQMAIFFVSGPDRDGTTPLMALMEKVLVAIAAAGEPLPNNPLLGERMGGHGRQSVDRALRALVILGRIRIECSDKHRRVWVGTTARFTGWGVTRKGHAPFSARARGTPAPEPPPPIIRLFAPKMSPIEIGEPDGCQYPVAEVDSRPLFCDAPVVRRRSYCKDHLGVCFSAGAPRATERQRAVWDRPHGVSIATGPLELHHRHFADDLIVSG